jgi:ABC-type glycerol-3-phosphate transport system substrate-binding protein
MLLFALVSCAPSGSKTKLPEKQRLENVYLATEYDMPENVYGAQMVKSGDNIYMLCRRETVTKDESGYDVYNYSAPLFLTDKAFSSYTEICNLETENNWSENSTTASGVSVNNIYPSPDGNVIVLYNRYFEDWSDEDNYIYEQNWSIEKIGTDGTTVSSLDIHLSTIESDYVYISDICPLDNGKYFILTDMSAFILNADGSIEKECDVAENISGAEVISDGRVIIFYYDENWNYCYGEYNITTGTFTEYATLPNSMNGNPIVTDDGRLFISCSTELVEYKLETAEEMGVEVNWLNSDINPNFIYNLTYMDGDFYNIDTSEWQNPRLMKYTPCDDVIEKYIINLACLYLDYEMCEKVIEFNRSQPEHRILVTAYGETDEEGNQLGTQKLDNEIIKGNIPDIISLDGLDFNKYASKGILADIGALIDADGEVSREDYLENILEFGSVNGKLCSLITAFEISTLIGKTSVVGDRFAWSWADLNAVLAKYPDAVAFADIEREPLLRNILRATLYDFVDYSTGTTKFESDDFAAILEFCKPYPEKIDWDTYYEDYDWEIRQHDMRDNKVLLQNTYFSTYWDLSFNLNNNSFGEEISMIGYPTTGESGSVIIPTAEWAISEKSPFKEQAFDFLKVLVSVENVDEIYTFSSNKEIFEQQIEKCIKEESQESEESEILPEGDIAVDMIYNENITREQADKFMKFAKSITGRQAPYDHEIINIIVEESAIYFAGEKSLEETCKIIQSRVFLYVSENM